MRDGIGQRHEMAMNTRCWSTWMFALLALAAVVAASSGCAVLTKSQVAAVGEFASASEEYRDLPGAVMDAHAEVHRTRQLLAASTIDDGETAAAQMAEALAMRRRLDDLSSRADASLQILGDYAALLQKLTSESYSKDLSSSTERLAKSLDAGISAYNKEFNAALPSVGAAAAAVIRGVGGIYIKSEQSKALRAVVPQADTVVREIADAVEQLLKTYITGAGGTGEELLKADIDELNELFMLAAAEAEGRLALATVVSIADAIVKAEEADKLAVKSMEAVHSLRQAHAELAEKVKSKMTLKDGIELVQSFVEEVRAAQALKKKLETS